MQVSQPLVTTDYRWRPALRRTFQALLRQDLWLLIGCVFAIDLLWGAWIGLSVAGWGRIFVTTAILLAVVAIYQHRFRKLADMAAMAALWVTFTATGSVLTYLAATCAFPLQDGMLMRYDRALNFDWVIWHDIVVASPTLSLVLSCVYGSLAPQILLSCLFLPALGMTGRCVELLRLAVLTLILTTLVSAFYPVIGPLDWSGGEQPQFLADLRILRAAGPWHFDLKQLQGIIQMPSYHTVLACLFTYIYRNTGLLGWVVAGLNFTMLFSIPPFGDHYLFDMLVGGAIAVLCIMGHHAVTRSWKGGERLIT